MSVCWLNHGSDVISDNRPLVIGQSVSSETNESFILSPDLLTWRSVTTLPPQLGSKLLAGCQVPCGLILCSQQPNEDIYLHVFTLRYALLSFAMHVYGSLTVIIIVNTCGYIIDNRNLYSSSDVKTLYVI